MLGRSGTGYPVGASTVTQQRLEELVFSLPGSYEVMFWRAMAGYAVARAQAHRARARQGNTELGASALEWAIISAGGGQDAGCEFVVRDVLRESRADPGLEPRGF